MEHTKPPIERVIGVLEFFKKIGANDLRISMSDADVIIHTFKQLRNENEALRKFISLPEGTQGDFITLISTKEEEIERLSSRVEKIRDATAEEFVELLHREFRYYDHRETFSKKDFLDKADKVKQKITEEDEKSSY